MSIKAIVADGSHLSGEIISCLLESDPEIEVGALVRDFLSLQRALSRHRADVLVADTMLPGLKNAQGRSVLTGAGIPVILLSRVTHKNAESGFVHVDSSICRILPKRISSAQEMADLRNALSRYIRETVKERSMLEGVA